MNNNPKWEITTAITKKNVAKANVPITTLRRSRIAEPGPSRVCEKPERIRAKTGNGDKSPLKEGPSSRANPVRKSTMDVATNIRRGISQFGEGMMVITSEGVGKNKRTRLKMRQIKMKESGKDNDISPKTKVAQE